MSDHPPILAPVIAYDEGRAAFFAGEHFTANPYNSLDVDVANNAISWAEGWLSARNDALVGADTEPGANLDTLSEAGASAPPLTTSGEGPVVTASEDVVDVGPELAADASTTDADAPTDLSPNLSPVEADLSAEALDDGSGDAVADPAVGPEFAVDADQAPDGDVPPDDVDPQGGDVKVERTLVEHGVRFAIEAPDQTAFYVTLTTFGLSEDGEKEIVERATVAIDSLVNTARSAVRHGDADAEFEDAEGVKNPFDSDDVWVVVELNDGAPVTSGQMCNSYGGAVDLLVPETTYERGPHAGKTFPACAVRIAKARISRIWCVSEAEARALRVTWERSNTMPWGTPSGTFAALVAALPSVASEQSTPS